MKKNFKNIIGTTTAIALIAGFAYLGIKNNLSQTTNKVINKSITGNIITSSTQKSTTPISFNIVIYNSEPNETYQNGKNVKDIGILLNTKLKEKGINSNFIKNPSPEKQVNSYDDYVKTYDITRKLITQNVKDYNNTILLDVCRDISPRAKNNIEIALSKTNPHYTENKKFADSLVEQFNKLNQSVSMYYYDTYKTYFNQDLSNRSIIIEIGNVKCSDSKLNQLVNLVTEALQNVK